VRLIFADVWPRRVCFNSRSKHVVFVVQIVKKELIFKQLHLFYPVSVILSMTQERIRRILSAKARIQLHLSKSGFVVVKVAMWHVSPSLLRFCPVRIVLLNLYTHLNVVLLIPDDYTTNAWKPSKKWSFGIEGILLKSKPVMFTEWEVSSGPNQPFRKSYQKV